MNEIILVAFMLIGLATLIWVFAGITKPDGYDRSKQDRNMLIAVVIIIVGAIAWYFIGGKE